MLECISSNEHAASESFNQLTVGGLPVVLLRAHCGFSSSFSSSPLQYVDVSIYVHEGNRLVIYSVRNSNARNHHYF